VSRPRSPRRAAARAAAALAVAAVASLGVAACAGGSIGQSTPASNGQSFVSGPGGVTTFGPGKGPLAPPVSGTALGGGKLALAGLRGHVVVMNFWGSWCTPCRAEAHVLGTLARRMHSAGVRFLGVDVRDNPASAEAFIRDFGIGYPSLNDPGGSIALDFRDTVPPAAIPTTLVIGRGGHITARVIGEVAYPELRQLISRAMAVPS
jgi:thiol-disulfide isomerase/thioredoxin